MGARIRDLTAGLRKMTAGTSGVSPDLSMATDPPRPTMDSDSSNHELADGATDMNLYTADLMVTDRMHDRERDFEANRLAALAREPREPERTRRAGASGSGGRPAGSG